jgi:hypothetical protein
VFAVCLFGKSITTIISFVLSLDAFRDASGGALAICDLGLGTWDLGLGTWDLGFGIWDVVLELHNRDRDILC